MSQNRIILQFYITITYDYITILFKIVLEIKLSILKHDYIIYVAHHKNRRLKIDYAARKTHWIKRLHKEDDNGCKTRLKFSNFFVNSGSA